MAPHSSDHHHPPKGTPYDDTSYKNTLSKEDQKLIKNLGLSKTEFERFKKLHMLSYTKITDLLNERKRFNKFVRQYLEEEINRERLAVLIHILFPTDYSLRYALKKVDEIEHDINRRLDHQNESPLFDKNTTKKNRIEMLLSVAVSYQMALKDELDQHEKNRAQPEVIEALEQKLQDLQTIMDELTLQLKTSELHIHNPTIFNIKDSDLSYFLSKLKAIGITGLPSQSATKEQSPLFRINIIAAIYERFNPNPMPHQDFDEEEDEDLDEDLDDDSSHHHKF